MQDSTSPSQPAACAHFVPQDLEVLCFKYALSTCVRGGCYILIAHPKYTPRALFALLPPVADPYHPINLPVMQYRRSEPLVPVSPNVFPDAFTHRSISNSVCIVIGPTIICMFFLVSVPTFSDSLLQANFTFDHVDYIFDGAGGDRFGVHTA
ncbi:hypothetical protein C8J57DRAFT_1332695 [Mycena rebaudengoi]|nr:hypothetical protein C8J57DRAFT_1332695 [Mycena rebaudengoi]